MKPSITQTILAILLCITLLPQQSHAIVWHSNLKNAPQSHPSGAMRQIVTIHYTRAEFLGGCGIQLDKNWILTARHSVTPWIPAMLTIQRGKEKRAIAKIVPHPDPTIDLALLKLANPLPVIESPILAKKIHPKGTRLWLGGYGRRGPVGNVTAHGTFAAGYNRLESSDGKRAKTTLDPPTSKQSEPNEVLPTLFDSGSPVFALTKNGWRLHGITVTASNPKSPGYGDRSHHQLIAPVTAWIKKHVPAQADN